jgi:hypothetical protein
LAYSSHGFKLAMLVRNLPVAGLYFLSRVYRRLTCAVYPADNGCTVTTSRSTPAAAAVGVLTLATLVSMTLLGSSTGAGAVILSNATQRVVIAGHEDEAAQWIATLAQAVKSLRGEPGLSSPLHATIAHPCVAMPSLSRQVMTYQPSQDDLPRLSPLPACHLIDIPPPQAV